MPQQYANSTFTFSVMYRHVTPHSEDHEAVLTTQFLFSERLGRKPLAVEVRSFNRK